MKQHVTDLLSEFVDGRLAEADRRMVETHVEKCEACGRELKDLKSLTTLLASTPRRPLPTGFLQRLERRAKEAATELERPRFVLPMPAKALAFGLSAVAVCLVGYDALNGPGRVEDRIRQSAPLAELAPGQKFTDRRARLASPEALKSAGELQSASREDEALSSAKKEARAPGAPIGAEEPAATAAAPGPAGRGESFRTPAPSRRAFTNEQLQRHLEAERRKMGIAAIVAPGSSMGARAPEPDAPPMSQEEARQYMRAMAEGLQRQRMGMENYSEPVALGGGAKPKLLKRDEGEAAGAPIVKSPQDKATLQGKSAPGYRGVRSRAARGAAKGGALEAAASMAQAPVTVLPYSSADSESADDGDARMKAPQERKNKAATVGADRLAAREYSRGTAARRTSVGQAAREYSRGTAARRTSVGQAAPKPQAAEKDASLAAPAAFAARTQEELRGLWKSLGNPGERPAVDFNTEMVVAVTAPGPVEIVRVWASGRRLVVEYRLLPDGDGNSAFRVVTKSDLPPALQAVK